MCGIVGYVQTAAVSTDVDDQYRQALAELLYIDSLRGMDSTGVACIPKDRRFKPFLLKRAVPGFAFVDLPEYEQVSQMQSNPGIFIGHNRAATRGSVNEENAHPFVADHITLVHNGSILNAWSIDSGLKHLDKGSAVDSCHIAHAIAKNGADKVLPNIDGPAALVWHDSKENSMNIALTEGRSIRWIFDIHGTCWFASEREMLWAVLVRNKIEPKDPKQGFIMMPEYSHFKWELGDVTAEMPGKLTRNTFPAFVPLWKKNQLAWEHRRREDNLKGGAALGEAKTGTISRNIWAGSTDSGTTGNETIKPQEPVSKRAVAKVDKKLESFGLLSGDKITVQRLSYTKSRGDSSLIDIACIWPDKKIKVLLPDCPQSYWDRSFNSKYEVIVYNILQELLPKEGRHQPCLYAKPVQHKIKDLVQGPGGVLIPKGEFVDLAKNGCNFCYKPVLVLDHEYLEWANGAPLCLQCSVAMNQDQRLIN